MFCQNILVFLNCIASQIKTMNCLEFDNHGAGLLNLQAKNILKELSIRVSLSKRIVLSCSVSLEC